MSTQALLTMLIMGAIAGWLAGLILKGHGLGLAGNVILGVFGAFVGAWLFGVLGIRIGHGLVAHLAEAVSGAVLLLLGWRLVAR